MLTRVEKAELSFTSPALFYGYSKEVDVILDFARDSQGRKLRNEKGALISKRKEVPRTYPCAYSSKEEVLHKLEDTYTWWRQLHPKHGYPPFQDCIKKVEPACPRVHPELHGIRLIMIPYN